MKTIFEHLAPLNRNDVQHCTSAVYLLIVHNWVGMKMAARYRNINHLGEKYVQIRLCGMYPIISKKNI